MHNCKLFVLFGIIIAFFGARAARAVTPPYAVSANNVTMPTTGSGSSQYSVTSIPMAGTLVVTCQYTGPTTVAKIPECYAAPVATPVTIGQTYSGMVTLYPFGTPIPVGLRKGRRLLPRGFALASALLLGVGLRRRRLRWIAVFVLTVGLMAGSMALSGCGSSVSNGMTPGTYVYTIAADNEAGGVTPLGAGASTTIAVTVP